jgi:4-aminobutyrate aminotransferase-like enzyme
MLGKVDQGSTGGPSVDTQDIVTRRVRALGPAYRLSYEKPVHFVRGDGVRLYDAQGREYLDAYNNVPIVGHCHPRVVAAIAQQAAHLNVNTRYASELVVEYAERLLATFPDDLSNIMFTCTGSEAVDLALRISRFHTRRAGIVVTANAYHGITTAVAEISPMIGDQVPLGQSVRTVVVPTSGDDVGRVFADGVRSAIGGLERHGVGFSALIVDTVFSSDGVFTDPAGFLQDAVKLVHAAGGLVVADEVQAGFGRTGEHMWGFSRHGIIPDLVVLGKPMGNGMPIAGVVARPELLADFGRKVKYFNTFAANSVCVAAAQAVLDVLTDERLMDNAKNVGLYLREGLSRIASSRPGLGEVRGAGLFAGADVVDSHAGGVPDGPRAQQIMNRLRERHVLIGTTGPFGNVLKIRPPLPFSNEDADVLLSILDDSLEDAEL